MAVKVKKILKKEIVTVAEGRTLGRMVDLRIDPDSHRISILILAAGSVHDSSIVIHGRSVRSFEADRIAIDDLDALKIAARDDEALPILSQGIEFKGREVISSTGEKLGKVKEVMVDAQGMVTEYRLRKGLRGVMWPAAKVNPADLGKVSGEVAVTVGSTLSSAADDAPARPAVDEDPR